jgi:hypothetical protein
MITGILTESFQSNTMHEEIIELNSLMCEGYQLEALGLDCKIAGKEVLYENAIIDGIGKFLNKIREIVTNFFKKLGAKIKEIMDKIRGKKSGDTESKTDVAPADQKAIDSADAKIAETKKKADELDSKMSEAKKAGDTKAQTTIAEEKKTVEAEYTAAKEEKNKVWKKYEGKVIDRRTNPTGGATTQKISVHHGLIVGTYTKMVPALYNLLDSAKKQASVLGAETSKGLKQEQNSNANMAKYFQASVLPEFGDKISPSEYTTKLKEYFLGEMTEISSDATNKTIANKFKGEFPVILTNIEKTEVGIKNIISEYEKYMTRNKDRGSEKGFINDYKSSLNTMVSLTLKSILVFTNVLTILNHDANQL